MSCEGPSTCGQQCSTLAIPEEPVPNGPDLDLKYCYKKCRNGHYCLSAAHEGPCPYCKVAIREVLPCGHEVYRECGFHDYKCEVKVINKIAKCGHPLSRPCHVFQTDAEHYRAVVQCTYLCGRKLPCGHTCRKLFCHEPCECNYETMNIKYPCGHEFTVPCKDYIGGYRPLCNLEMISKKILDYCGHEIRIPCVLESMFTPKALCTMYCNKPCAREVSKVEEGGCGHPCSGTCVECNAGKYHARCTHPCGRTLDCGHVCTRGCAEDCVPCPQVCSTSCEHGPCKLPCGLPCPPCQEPCTWECFHQSCTKKCGEPCDREPCEYQCVRTLPCGHGCVCFCGEPCSPLCRICDYDTLMGGVFTGNTEILKSDRFVYLVNCGHTIEIESLTGWMEAETKDGEITTKVCPLCRAVISSCRKFHRILHSELIVRNAVKEKILELAKEEKDKEKDTEAAKLAKIQRTVSRFKRFAKKSRIKTNLEFAEVEEFFDQTQKLIPKVKPFEFNGLCFVMNLFSHLMKTTKYVGYDHYYSNKFNDKQMDKDYMIIFHKFLEIFNLIQMEGYPETVGEIADLNRIVKQIDYFVDLLEIRPRKPTKMEKRILDTLTVKNNFTNARNILTGNEVFHYGKRVQVEGILKKLRDVFKTKLGIDDKERESILQAFGRSAGRWFQCKNGHVYVVTECGGAMQRGICPECKEEIGGGEHQILEDNSLATAMDGATRPLFRPIILPAVYDE